MKINPSLSGTANVIALIREANPRFTFNELAIKIVNVEGRVPDVVPYNTQALVEGRNPTEFYNPVHVYYNRRSMKEAVDAPTQLYSAGLSTTFDDLLGWIAAELKLVTTEFEFVNFRTLPDATISIVSLKPVDKSRLYVPEIMDVTLSWSGDAAEYVAILAGSDELNKLVNVTMPSPGYI